MAIEFEDEFMDDADFAALDAAMQVCCTQIMRPGLDSFTATRSILLSPWTAGCGGVTGSGRPGCGRSAPL